MRLYEKPRHLCSRHHQINEENLYSRPNWIAIFSFLGTYTTPQGKRHTSAFLGLQKMETEKKLNNGADII